MFTLFYPILLFLFLLFPFHGVSFHSCFVQPLCLPVQFDPLEALVSHPVQSLILIYLVFTVYNQSVHLSSSRKLEGCLIPTPFLKSPPTSPSATHQQRVLLVANTSWYLYNFRLPLIRDLRRHGYQVALVAPHDSHTELLHAEGLSVHNWMVARSSVNPLSEAHALVDLWRIYEREQPDLVHHFTIKACLYGTIAAKAARVYRVINAITGLGHVFLGTRRRSRLLRGGLRPLYSAVFKARRSTVVFQNADDQDRLIQLGITDGERARLIRGSGVDIDHFRPLLTTPANIKILCNSYSRPD